MFIVFAMPRPRSEKVHSLKAKLIARLTDGFHRPGSRFLSGRAVAERFGVSYQTAHFIIQELVTEKFLERRAASGTYIAGRQARLRGAELWFNARAKRNGSFGGYLLERLRSELEKRNIPHLVRWGGRQTAPAEDFYPVLWEVPLITAAVVADQRYALLLNDRPAPGLESSLLDAVATDDFSAGVCAAQVLSERTTKRGRFAVLGGPQKDDRSRNRIAGFLSLLPDSQVVSANGWYFEDAARVAKKLLATKAAGIFCVNDRLASAVLAHCKKNKIKPPLVVGHDNAPVAEELHLTTIETPWRDLIAAAATVIVARLDGDSNPARQVILAQRPVYRLTA